MNKKAPRQQPPGIKYPGLHWNHDNTRMNELWLGKKKNEIRQVSMTLSKNIIHEIKGTFCSKQT